MCYDVRIDDPRQSRRDALYITFDGCALLGGLQDDLRLGLCKKSYISRRLLDGAAVRVSHSSTHFTG